MALTVTRADVVHISRSVSRQIDLRITVKDGEIDQIFFARMRAVDDSCEYEWDLFHISDREQLAAMRAAIDEVLQELDKDHIA